MSEQSFTTAITVDGVSARQVYDAVLDPRAWWSEEIDGPADRVGAEFGYHYLDTHRTRMRVTEAVPGRRVAWLVLDNDFAFVEDKTEWIGNTITFDITEKDGATELVFTQHGLVPSYDCYDACHSAWTFFVTESLPALLTTGEGRPNSDAKPRVPAEVAAANGRL
ncbi:SRPBCC family protein [Actinomadura gamaensis]|uniref:SRPBCC domain-containing protein n=1 Tax=Actinomadura gamaensis TaxID=1763541 RepID=A0ABV9TWM8_9ACTN